MKTEVEMRRLVAGDEPRAEAFLTRHAATTMILRSNLVRAGLTFRGSSFEGDYVGAFAGEELVGVVAHYWNDNVALAGGEHVPSLVREVVTVSGRTVRGLLGPWSEVVDARRSLGLGTVQHEGREVLFALDLDALHVPEALRDPSRGLEARAPTEPEMPLLLEWRMAYAAETTGVVDTPDSRRRQAETLRAFHASGDDVLLLDHGEPVAYTAFNAAVSDMVQVGGVWTPPPLRGRGYARCAVAASLLRVRERGAKQAILFTGEENLPAQKSYAALGFRARGDYGIVLV